MKYKDKFNGEVVKEIKFYRVVKLSCKGERPLPTL